MSRTKIIFIATGIFLVIFVGFGLVKKNNIEVSKGSISLDGMSLPESGLSGEKCENAKARPMAVMLSSDPETRPLSGIGEADLVFEMPVTEGEVTRMMAVFQCRQPKEIGSVRSARLDFIPWAQGLEAVYAHWGGERDALNKLNAGVVDNIDAMKYEGTYYYRRKGARAPHDGFTSFELLKKAVIKLGYALGKSVPFYLHEKGASLGIMEPPLIYKGKFAVQWKYQPESNTYFRWRGEKEEIDRNTSKLVEAANIVLLKTTWSPISKDYINVKTVGSGEAVIYKNGETVVGAWEKKTAAGRLIFYDITGQEVKFVVGPIWIETLIK